MSSRDFKPLLNPTTRPAPGQKPSFTSFVVKDSLTLPTLLALGALIQTVTLAILPARYALLPLGLLLGRAAITTILQTRSPAASHNPLLADIIRGRSTAQLPLRGGGIDGAGGVPFGHEPAASSIVAFHLGIHFNHPLGFLAPGAKEIGAHFRAMTATLTASTANRAEFGLLSTSTWRGTDRDSGNTILMVAYFRDVAGLNKFAHSKVHRDGWDWYLRFVRETGHRHFGLFHETFLSRKGEWETIYDDCAPTLLGAGNWRVDGEEGVAADGKAEGEEVWTRPLVSADHPVLKTQAKRMGSVLGLKEETQKV